MLELAGSPSGVAATSDIVIHPEGRRDRSQMHVVRKVESGVPFRVTFAFRCLLPLAR